MNTTHPCPECGISLHNGKTCQDYFHQMLAWEYERPGYGALHHLIVLCYHLQHPNLYSPDGLRGAITLIEDFLERGVSPVDARRQQRASVTSNNRTWKIKGTPNSHGEYERPIQWTMTAQDVIENGLDNYLESVRMWARSVYDALKDSRNLSSRGIQTQ